MKKKRLIWLHSHILFWTGGTRFIFEVLTKLNKFYDVTLIVEKADRKIKKEFLSEGIKVKEINNSTSNSINYWALFPFYIIKDYFNIKEKVKKNDIVISSMFPFNFIGSFLGVKHIYYCFEPFAFFYDTELMKQQGIIKYFLLVVLKLIYSQLDKLGTRKASLILSINPSVGKNIKSIYKIKPKNYTYLGVDTNHFNKNNKKKDKKRLEIFHSTDYTLLKGTQYLIPILKDLTKIKDLFTITISDSITHSDLKKKLIKEIKKFNLENNFNFIGNVPYSELPKYYSQSDLYLFIGNPDSQGATAASLSVLESQACGTPVLRSIGNNDEIVKNKTGFYVNPKNGKDLFEIIKYLSLDKSLIMDMRKNCRQHILNKYTWDKVTSVFVKSIESIL